MTPRDTSAPGSALERALDERGGRREGREVRFRCPAHDDAHPSARFHLDKGVWFCDVCKAGGGRRDLAHRLGLEPHRRNSSAPRRELVAAYPYRDAQGRLLYEVLRLAPKDFRVRRPAPDGGWLWNLGDTPRVLYRLPELAAALAAREPVFLVEGEKDADALARLGLAATTSPGGAGKWRPDYCEPLRGAEVVLVPDHDEPGRRHMDDAARGLRAVAARLRLLLLPGLPDKGDVSDWLAARTAAGRSPAELRAELLALTRQAPEGRAPARSIADIPGLRSFLSIAPQPITFLWPPYIALGKLTFLEGDPGQGKSWIALSLAACGSTGRALPGTAHGEPFRTLMLTAEDGLADTLRPRLDTLGADTSKVFTYELPLRFVSDEDLETLDGILEVLAPRLLVLDPIVAFLGPALDAYRANEVRSVLAPLAALAERRNCAILAIRHLNKAKSGRSIYAGQGSIDFTAAARSVLLAGTAPDDPRRRAMVHIKSNLAPLGPACGFAIDAGLFTWTGPTRLTAADLLAAETRSDDPGAGDEAAAFLRNLLDAGPRPAREIFAEASEAGIADITLRRAKRREGLVVTRQGFSKGSVSCWSLPSPPHTCSSPLIDAHAHTRSSMEPPRSSMAEAPAAAPPGRDPIAAPADPEPASAPSTGALPTPEKVLL
jgi:putative DNA primase/helicase